MILTKNKIEAIDLNKEIDRKISAGKLNELLIVVPTNRKIRSLKKEIITKSPNQSADKINLETIGTFSTKLLFKDPAAVNKVLSEEAASVLLKQSFQSVKLSYFTHYKKDIPFGTLNRIRNVISEYKRHGFSPEQLKNSATKLEGSEKVKALDIASTYENYLVKIRSIGVKEIGDIYEELNRLDKNEFANNFRFLYPEINLIVINGFDEFTQPEIEIINSASNLKDAELFLSFDYYQKNPTVFSHLNKCYNKLIEKGFSTIIDKSEETYSEFQITVRKKLFYDHTKKINSFKEQIKKLAAPNREKEIAFIAKEIKDLIQRHNVLPHKICVVFNLIDKYSPIIRDQFKVYGIPFNLTDRFSLSTSRPVIAIINFLEILENDFYYKNIFRSLNSTYFSIEKVDLTNLLRTSIKLKIIAGFETWRIKLNDAINNPGENEDDFRNIETEKEEYKKALGDIEKLYETLNPFNKKMTLTEFREKLNDLIFPMGIPSKLIEHGNNNIEENVKAVTTFLDSVNEILNILKLEYGDDEKFPLKFYLNHLRTILSSARYNIKERAGYGVQVTTMNEIRGLNFDYLFISGLCDGDFPTRYSPEIFFSGSYVKSENYHQTEERYHFYQTLCAWEKVLYLTFPLSDEQKELVESNFSQEFSSLFDLTEINANKYPDKIYSKEELLQWIGEGDNPKINEQEEINVLNLNFSQIENALNVDKIRLAEPFGNYQFTGFVKDYLSTAGKEKLEEFKDKEYSISQLETYAKCPYKYFAERVLKLEIFEEPTEEIEALEMGSILHVILFEFYSEIRKKGLVLFNCSDDDFIFAKEIIFKIAEEKTSRVQFSSPLTFYEKEKILGINRNRNESILYKFLIKERENNDGYIPEFFEYGFGSIDKKRTKKSLENLKIDDVKIRGKIDRIDVNKKEESYKVIDYKLSGKKPGKDDLLNGISLQLPLYLYAAKEIIKAELNTNEEFKPTGADIYSLKYSQKDFGRNTVHILKSVRELKDNDAVIESYEELMKICKDAVKKYVEAIANGEFHLTTLEDRENKVCGYCSFRPICRIQEVN